MLRPLVGLVLLVHGNSGWWAPANATDPPEGPWKAWARTKSPRLVEQMDTFADSMDGVTGVGKDGTEEFGPWPMVFWV